jgi:hypothetical protein
MFIGRIDDTFIITTRGDDIVTFTPSSPAGERVERHETNLQSLYETALWSDGVLLTGDGDEVLHFDVEDGVTLLYDGTSTDGPCTIGAINEYTQYAIIMLPIGATLGITPEWDVIWGA